MTFQLRKGPSGPVAIADVELVDPFKATFYVNPAFAGTSTGSQSNPYKSIALAFAAAAALGLSGAVLKIPPNTTVTEDIVFPATGGNWEIASDLSFSGSTVGSIISGSVTMDATGVLRSKFTNVIITGNISGNAPNGAAILYQATCVRQNGGITLTQAGTGVCLCILRGIGPAYPGKPSGSNTLAVNIAGQIFADNWVFEGGFSCAAPVALTPYYGSTFSNCQLGSTNGTPVTCNLNENTLNAFFYDCRAAGPVTMACGVADYVVYMDGATIGALTNPVAGLILTGTNAQIKTINANASDRRTLANNLGSTNFGARNVDGLYEVVFDQTLLVGGTVGLLQLNVIYTDMTGTLVTVPVGGTLNIAAAVGTKNQGSLVFRHNGAAAPIAFSYTGIVTPDAMSVAASVALMCRT